MCCVSQRYGKYLIGGHSNVLKDVGAVQEEDVVGIRVESWVQGGVQRCVGGNGKGSVGTSANIQLQSTTAISLRKASASLTQSSVNTILVRDRHAICSFSKAVLENCTLFPYAPGAWAQHPYPKQSAGRQHEQARPQQSQAPVSAGCRLLRVSMRWSLRVGHPWHWWW